MRKQIEVDAATIMAQAKEVEAKVAAREKAVTEREGKLAVAGKEHEETVKRAQADLARAQAAQAVAHDRDSKDLAARIEKVAMREKMLREQVNVAKVHYQTGLATLGNI